MEKTEKNVAQLTDDEILEGFRNADEHIVKEYFYGYCRVAYYIYDRRYDLQYKPGMDFYSLAHEYYLALIKHNFRQLEDRKPSMSLKTWMVNGFRFLVLDKLKGLKKEQLKESLEERMGNTSLKFDVHDDEFAEEFRGTIDEICRTYYGCDSRNAIILQMLFVEGFKGKEIAAQLGISQPAVTERYNRMMHDVVVPYFKRYFVTNKYGLRMNYIADECMLQCRVFLLAQIETLYLEIWIERGKDASLQSGLTICRKTKCLFLAATSPECTAVALPALRVCASEP